MGARHVVDTAFSREITMLEARAEFVARSRAAGRASVVASASEAGGVVAAAAAGGAALAATGAGKVEGDGEVSSAVLPLVASSCPGWVCYAEKSQPFIVPHISNVKSPEAVMGSLVKRWLAPKLGVEPAAVAHISVQVRASAPSSPALLVLLLSLLCQPLTPLVAQPCYDKKLEIARPDLSTAGSADTEVVLTTDELELLIAEKHGPSGLAAESLEAGALDTWFTQHSTAAAGGAGRAAEEQEQLIGGVPRDTGSGGYLEAIFRHAARELHGVEIPWEQPLQYVQGRNADVSEVTLEVEGKVLMRFAMVYGFRNIQNIVRKIKRAKVQYDYVEIMACPGGCANGGGQLGPADGAVGKEALDATMTGVQAVYAAVLAREPGQSEIVQGIYRELLGGAVGSAAAREQMHWRLQAVEKTEGLLALPKW